MTESRRVLVTGGAGFVGATLVRRLAGAGYRVRVLDNYSTGDPSYLDGVHADLVEGDIRDDRALGAALAGMDAVVHLAAAGSVITSVADPAANFDVNVVGTFRVLDAARRAGVERTVQASTGGALIGDATPPVTEHSLPKPISPYGASKLAGEGYAHAFAAAYGLRTVALRFGNVYGPWSARKPAAMTLFFRAIQAGEPIVICGDGSASRDFTHVEDIARDRTGPGARRPGRHRAAHRIRRGDHRAGTGRPVPHHGRRAGSPGRVPARAGRRGGRNFASYDLARQVLGYAPSISREDGIRRTWQ